MYKMEDRNGGNVCWTQFLCKQMCTEIHTNKDNSSKAEKGQWWGRQTFQVQICRPLAMGLHKAS